MRGTTFHSHHTPRRVVVVEDDPHCLRLLVDALEYDGYEVAPLPSSQGAHTIIKQFVPDVVICDLLFHGAPDGIELIQHVLADHATKHIPIVLCSAAVELVLDQMPWLEQHGVFVLLKPFELHVLSATVHAAAACAPPLAANTYGR